ncbi:hypothetical protein [Bradyrhizobium elkanii]|nr:hypothetical protein [Bradyrhizobium elkanii]
MTHRVDSAWMAGIKGRAAFYNNDTHRVVETDRHLEVRSAVRLCR